MGTPSMEDSTIIGILRASASTWMVTALIPLPILVAIDPARSADVSSGYLGLGCAWLAMDIYRDGGLPASTSAWATKMSAICLAVATNALLFIGFGLAAGVQTFFPFPLMAMLSVIPAIGMVPWLVRRLRGSHSVMVIGCILVLAAKLLACIVARIKYGPDYMAQGYVAADWRTARLMISLFWTFSTAISLLLLLLERRVVAQSVATSPGPTAATKLLQTGPSRSRRGGGSTALR